MNRQAINYANTLENLREIFLRIFQHLKNGGRFIFNTPHWDGKFEETEREIDSEFSGWNVHVAEKNFFSGENMLTHSQRVLLTKIEPGKKKMRKFFLNFPGKFPISKKMYDVNSFGMFTRMEFEKILGEVGFSQVEWFGKGLEILEKIPTTKSLYCVATKNFSNE